jgi:predicted Zn-dependent protease
MMKAAVVAVLFALVLVVSPAAGPALAADAAGLFGMLFGGFNVLPVDQEEEIARTFAREIESKQQILRDPEVNGLVNQIGQRLVSKLQRPEFRYRFRVVVDPSVNAFGIGGGYIYVHTGLIAAAATEGQFASVVAHEIGHQVRRHVAKTISRQALFQQLARAAVGAKSSQWIALAANLGITTGQLAFSREAEHEADEVMVGLMLRAGYDPREALGMFATLRKLEGRSGGGGVAAIFSSHPPTSDRSQRIQQQIARLRLGKALTRDTKRYQETRRRIVAGGR